MANRIVIAAAAAAVAAAVLFGAASLIGRNGYEQATTVAAIDDSEMVRPHSPVIGRADAPVTIVEFFDPACEGCRAFHPYVEELLATYSDDVKLVLRYVPFHRGSDEAVRILDAARLQGVFEPVLRALLEQQPAWAAHSGPDLAVAWQLAGSAGLDLQRARIDAFSTAADRVLEQDMADARAVRIQQTPTFFVNGEPLAVFGPDELRGLVRDEVERSRNR